MPFRDYYNQEPVRRFSTIEEFEQDQASRYSEDDFSRQMPLFSPGTGRSIEDDMPRLNSARENLNLQQKLGWGQNENGDIPKDANGHSRMYIMRKNSQGQETLMEYDGHRLSDGSVLEMNSFGFFDEMLMGNVFAYPLGDDEPVQLQMKHRNGDVSFSISKPLQPDDLSKCLEPQPPEPRRPGFFRSLMNRWFGAFQRDFDDYNKAVELREAWDERKNNLSRQAMIQTSGRKLGQVPNEKEQAKALKEAEVREKELEAERAIQAKLEDDLNNAKKVAGQTELGQKLSEAIYEPDPKIISTEETEALYPGRTVKDDGVHESLFQGAYTDKQGIRHVQGGYFNGGPGKNYFGDLTRITKDDLDLDSIKVGQESVTKSDFCNLALFAGMDPKIGAKNYHITPEYDPTLKPAMQQLKETDPETQQEKRAFSDEEIDALISGSCSSMYTTDTHKLTPRGQSGVYIKTGIDPARLAVRDALNEYKAGKNGKLAQIIATGINEEAGAICQMEASAGEEMMGGIAASKSMIKLLNADPNLKDAAFKAGMKEKNLWTVEGAQELAVLHQKAADANVKLFQAAVDGKELPLQEKAQAVKDIIKGKVALESMLVDNKKSQGEKIDTYFAKFAQGAMPPTEKDNPRQVRYYDENGGLIMPKKGVPYMTSGVHMTESMKRYYKEKPASVMLLKTPTGKKNLDTIADQIVAEDKLLDLSTKDLANKLNFAGSQVNTKYGERGIRKMAEQGMVTKDTMQELKHELKTGQVSPKMEQPKKAEQVVQAEINIQNKGKMVEGNQPGIR